MKLRFGIGLEKSFITTIFVESVKNFPSIKHSSVRTSGTLQQFLRLDMHLGFRRLPQVAQMMFVLLRHNKKIVNIISWESSLLSTNSHCPTGRNVDVDSGLSHIEKKNNSYHLLLFLLSIL